MTTATNHGHLTCSCGHAGLHRIAERETADGWVVCLWSDGAIAGRLGNSIPGVPIARPRTEATARVALAAGWLFLDEVALYDSAELPALYAAARRVAARGGSHVDLRRAMARV